MRKTFALALLVGGLTLADVNTSNAQSIIVGGPRTGIAVGAYPTYSYPAYSYPSYGYNNYRGGVYNSGYGYGYPNRSYYGNRGYYGNNRGVSAGFYTGGNRGFYNGGNRGFYNGGGRWR